LDAPRRTEASDAMWSSRSRSPSSCASAGSPPRSRRSTSSCSATLSAASDYRDVGEDFRATVKRAAITTAGERLSPEKKGGLLAEPPGFCLSMLVF